MGLSSENLDLKSGRSVHVFAGVLGIGANGQAFHGYDGYLEPNYTQGPPLVFTEAERQEIAELAILRWKAWAATERTT